MRGFLHLFVKTIVHGMVQGDLGCKKSKATNLTNKVFNSTYKLQK